MNYATELQRKTAGVCVKCEAVPVVANNRCLACATRYRDADRLRARLAMKCTARQMWSPEKQIFISIDDREAYTAIRAQVAKEIESGVKGLTVCEKYRLTWTRLRKICVEYGVTRVTKTPERLALEAAVLEDARSGMTFRDMIKKYPGHAVRYICKRAGVTRRDK